MLYCPLRGRRRNRDAKDLYDEGPLALSTYNVLIYLTKSATHVELSFSNTHSISLADS